MEQIRLKWLEDKARNSSVTWFPGADGNRVLLNKLVKSPSEEKGDIPLT